ncbi:helix-turn-helix domain-containing protein [Paenibacillus sp. FSL K6-1230]|uniref:helix-turn-helix domain-containing protein n=1 Tax=Paenibacillus sp. FSL K6-1230 TaxID=2921603 RepID=UPI0030F5ADC8
MVTRDQMLLWTCASIDIVDIRHSQLQLGEELDYVAPAELFLISGAGMARIEAGDVICSSEGSPVVHVGKGTRLHISQVSNGLEYVLILYKASLPQQLPSGLLEPELAVDSFGSCYGGPPGSTAMYRSIASDMDRLWHQEDPLARLEAKQRFYAFVQLLLTELERLEGAADKTEEQDMIASALWHMEACYNEPITLSSLAERLLTSPRQLQRGFKTRFGHGPMEHLIGIRMERAKRLLEQSGQPVAQIAEEVGYPDSYYFSRLFKKKIGQSPRGYRQTHTANPFMTGVNCDNCRISPSSSSQTVIVPAKFDSYHQRVSATQSFRALLSLTLMCTGGLAYVDDRIRMPHMRGILELERKPERIVVLDYQYSDQLLSLGVCPVGSVACSIVTDGLPLPLKQFMGSMYHLGTKEQPDLQALGELQPDLIVCTSFQEHCYGELLGIAPTVMFDRNEDWRVTLLRFGELVGRQHQALEILDGFNTKLDRLRRRIEAGHEQTVALIRPRDGSIRLHTERHRTARLLYEDLGLAPPALAVKQAGTSSLIPLETLPELQADRLFVLTDNLNQEQTQLYEQHPLWSSMSAVRSGRVRHFHTALWTGYYGPLAMNRVVDEIEETLLPPITSNFRIHNL